MTLSTDLGLGRSDSVSSSINKEVGLGFQSLTLSKMTQFSDSKGHFPSTSSVSDEEIYVLGSTLTWPSSHSSLEPGLLPPGPSSTEPFQTNCPGP